ncbi:MAG TPA: tubulin-like doman-containing protein [Caldilineaceae bacterium]|nr:tubulin-like doman-containing protein [Caldilineaceae bacterium]
MDRHNGVNFEKPTIYPTMVVGVGGMGTNTVRAVKRRFRQVWNGNQPPGSAQNQEHLPGMIQLLALDTEPLVNRLDQEPLFADEFAYMGKFDATRLIANLDQHPEIARWWDYPTIPLGYIHNGAKQLRPIGRLCFFRNYVTFKQLFETKLTNLDKIRDMEVAQNRGFPVVGNLQLIYVVSSLCGGTGSGMFMDVAHRIRAQVRNNARVVGIFFLPDVLESELTSDLQRRRIRANAYAALKELNYFQETQKFSVLYPSEQRELPDTPYAPFDFIFLVGRTNRNGYSLARKSDAEQMAAHLIQTTAISHLSSEILGLEVNVVRERMFDMEAAAGEAFERHHPNGLNGGVPHGNGGNGTNGNGSNGNGSNGNGSNGLNGNKATKRRNFLVYSSFATSALVAPHESLVDFWQRAFVSDLIRRFAAGPTLADPRTALPEGDQQRIMNLWQGLQQQLMQRYAALENDKLDVHRNEIEEQRGIWPAFWEPVMQTTRQALLDTGIRGALALCDLVGPPGGGMGMPDSLPRQRLFLVDGHPVTEEMRHQWRRILAQQGDFSEQAQQIAGSVGELFLLALNPRRARERARDLATRKARSRLYQKRDSVEQALVTQLGKQAGRLREALRSQLNACTIALAKANQEAGRIADRIDPRIPDGYPSTSTFYELETGAVGRDYLPHFVRSAAGCVTATDWRNSIAPLCNQLLQGLNAIAPDQIYSQLYASVVDNSALIKRVHETVDINHIITTQHLEEKRRVRQRPDNRIHQWLERLNPYIRWDADRYSFHESNLEHIRLAAVPFSRQEDANMQAATVGQEDVKWIPTGDATRMDAVWIVHGLPVTLLERIEEYRAQYENRFDFNVREEFHLNPDWANLPEITPEDEPSMRRPATIPRVEPSERRVI